MSEFDTKELEEIIKEWEKLAKKSKKSKTVKVSPTAVKINVTDDQFNSLISQIEKQLTEATIISKQLEIKIEKFIKHGIYHGTVIYKGKKFDFHAISLLMHEYDEFIQILKNVFKYYIPAKLTIQDNRLADMFILPSISPDLIIFKPCFCIVIDYDRFLYIFGDKMVYKTRGNRLIWNDLDEAWVSRNVKEFISESDKEFYKVEIDLDNSKILNYDVDKEIYEQFKTEYTEEDLKWSIGDEEHE